MNEEKNKADWLSFVMHFIVGIIIGAGFSFGIIIRRPHSIWSIWLEDHLVLPFILGGCLLGGGLGSKYGDRLWIGDNYKVIPPTTMEQSDVSAFLSMILIVLGVVLLISSLARHFTS